MTRLKEIILCNRVLHFDEKSLIRCPACGAILGEEQCYINATERCCEYCDKYISLAEEDRNTIERYNEVQARHIQNSRVSLRFRTRNGD